MMQRPLGQHRRSEIVQIALFRKREYQISGNNHRSQTDTRHEGFGKTPKVYHTSMHIVVVKRQHSAIRFKVSEIIILQNIRAIGMGKFHDSLFRRLRKGCPKGIVKPRHNVEKLDVFPSQDKFERMQIKTFRIAFYGKTGNSFPDRKVLYEIIGRLLD